MKKTGFLTLLLAALLLVFMPGGSRAETKDRGKMTLMIYMCGSNLESGYGAATSDLMEMSQNAPGTNGVTVLVMTGGSSRWAMGFEDGKTQIHEISKRGMRAVWPAADEGSVSLNMGDPATLTTFLEFGTENYPADSYALILWDHGGGPMTGICWDEVYSMDNLSVADVAQSLKDADFGISKLEWIGFDACLMGTLEVACTMAPYARYMIASEETEPALGWNYSFLRDLGKDADGGKTGRRIADTFYKAANGKGEDLTISVIDLSNTTLLCQSLDQLFSPLAGNLSEDNFQDASVLRMRTVTFGKSDVGGGDNAYDLVDLGDLIRNTDSEESASAMAALESTVIYNRTNVEGATGLSIYFPYRNKDQYVTSWHDSYRYIPSSSGFADYIFRFGTLLTADEMTDWSGLKARIEGTDPQGKGCIYACTLTEEQAASIVSARMLVLQPNPANNGVDDSYALVGDFPAELGEDNVLRTTYNGQLLYAVVPEGRTDYLTGPLGYHMLDDGITGAIPTVFQPKDSSAMQNVELGVILFDLPKKGDVAQIRRVVMRDTVTGTYTSRISYDKDRYSMLQFQSHQQAVPPNDENGTLPGFRSWPDYSGRIYWQAIDNVPKWRLQFFDQSVAAEKVFILFEVTDAQQNSFCSSMVPMYNPAATAVGVTTGAIETDQYRVSLAPELVNSRLDQYLSLEFTVTNNSDVETEFWIRDVRLNGTRMTSGRDYAKLNPGETKKLTVGVYPNELTGMTDLSWLKATITMEPQPDGEETEEEISFGLDQVDVSKIAAQYPLLGVAESDGVTWRLLNVDLDDHGELVLLFHIINDREEEIELVTSPPVAVNGIQSYTSGYLEVLPGCDTISRVEVQDSVLLDIMDRLEVQDQISFLRHGVLSRQLQLRHGYSTVKNVSLVFKIKTEQWGGEKKSVTLNLKQEQKIPNFRQNDQNYRWYGPVKNVKPANVRLLPLLDYPQAGVWVERALVCDNGLAAVIEIENRTDQLLETSMRIVAVNGESVSGRDSYCYILPGCVYCDKLTAEYSGENISSVTIQISGLDEKKDPEIELVFASPVRLGAKGGTVLETNKMTAEIPSVPEPIENTQTSDTPAFIENTLIQTGVRYLGKQVHYADTYTYLWYNCADDGHSFILWPDGSSKVIFYTDLEFTSYKWETNEDGSILLYWPNWPEEDCKIYTDGEWTILEELKDHTCYRFKPEE